MMSDRLDRLLAKLAAAPTDQPLALLEAHIGRGVNQYRCDSRAASALTPVRIASVALALAMGVTFGGVTASTAITAPQQPNAFAVEADLAPSTLLDGGR